jgi:hypothetical protein
MADMPCVELTQRGRGGFSIPLTPGGLLKAKAQAADRAAKIAKEKARLAKGDYKASCKAFKQAKKAAKQAAKRAKQAQIELADCLAKVSTERKLKTVRGLRPSPQTAANRTVAKPISARQKQAVAKPVEQKPVEITTPPTTQSEKPRWLASSEPDSNIELSGLRQSSTPKPKS